MPPPPHCPPPLLTPCPADQVIYCSPARQAAAGARPALRSSLQSRGFGALGQRNSCFASTQPWLREGLTSKTGRGELAEVAGGEGTCQSPGLCCASGSPAALGIIQVLMHGLIHQHQRGWERHGSLAAPGKVPAPMELCGSLA